VPKVSASLYLDQTFGEGNGIWTGFGIGAGIRFISNSASSIGEHQVVPSATLVDASARYDLGRLSRFLEKMQIALNVSNLFDTKYVARCDSETACFCGNRRLVLGSLVRTW
jgi:iron complex outermembrane recepter protein